jgi:hypothetical protein
MGSTMMKEDTTTHDSCCLSLFKTREERKVQQMRALFSGIALFDRAAAACHETGGAAAERKYWLDLYDEVQNERFRSLLIPRREP